MYATRGSVTTTPLSSRSDQAPNWLICLPIGVQPRYRADQVWDWLYDKLAADPAEMTNLPKTLRERLAAETRINPLQLAYEQRSADGQTIKWLFRLPDGLTIETVLMLYDETKHGRASARRRGARWAASSAPRARPGWRAT